MWIYFVQINHKEKNFFQGASNTTEYFRESTHAVTTEWPWPWHPDIHWYHQYINLSYARPEIWDGLHLGVLTQLRLNNNSHPAYKWIAHIIPNITALNILYKEQYEGTGRNMLVCLPTLVETFPDWVSWEQVWLCGNYTPQDVEHYYNLDDLGFVYNREKHTIDVFIGVGTVITVIGVLGKTFYFCLYVVTLRITKAFGLP